MAVIVCHSPKGGTGTTFLAGQLALAMADRGRDVTVISMATADSLPLHFGLPPAVTLPDLEVQAEDAVVVQGIDLRNCARAPRDPDFVPMLQDAGLLSSASERVLIIDVPSGERGLVQRLLPFATIHLCALTPAPDCIALLPQFQEELGEGARDHTLFVVNSLDETRRLARHSTAFLRELFGPNLIGRVRQDESVVEALAMLQTLGRYAPSSAALADVTQIAEEMLLRLAARAAIAPQSTPGEPGEAGDIAPAGKSRAA
ncbi:MAG TPA: cellulose synthase operon protein YhjQ/BcsQ [Sphingomonadaceae bacterium]|nr:cellulose synthase operon protein YhjQ/BcsQ [Sphingomonadaceae bacterium]